MKYFSTFLLIALQFTCFAEPVKHDCKCIDCHCIADAHCGCLAQKGCPYKPKEVKSVKYGTDESTIIDTSSL